MLAAQIGADSSRPECTPSHTERKRSREPPSPFTPAVNWSPHSCMTAMNASVMSASLEP